MKFRSCSRVFDVPVLREVLELSLYIFQSLLSKTAQVPRMKCVCSTPGSIRSHMVPICGVSPPAAAVRSTAPAFAGRHSTRMQACSHTFAESPLHSDMLQALHAVRVASQACMSVQRSLQKESINTKTDDSPVTIADYAAQAIIAWMLQKSCEGRYRPWLATSCYFV
jgi:hypothetical protein